MSEEEKKGDDAAKGGEPEAKTPAKGSSAPKEVSSIKPGDYTVHLLL